MEVTPTGCYKSLSSLLRYRKLLLTYFILHRSRHLLLTL